MATLADPPAPPQTRANRLRAVVAQQVRVPDRRDTPQPPRPAAATRAGLLPWVPVLLSVGIAIWLTAPVQHAAIWVAVALTGTAGLALAWRAPHWADAGRLGWTAAEWLRHTGLATALIAAGLGLSGLRAHMTAAPVLEFRYYGPVEGRVVMVDRSGRDRMRLTLDQVVLRDMSPLRTPVKVRLSLMDQATDNLPAPGQRVMLTGHLGPPPGPASPYSFDFRLMAWFEQIGAVGYARTPVMTVTPPEGGIWAMHRVRMDLSRAMQDRIGGQAGAVAAALMTGDRSGIHEATNEVMRASNLYHIISISGLHMGMLAGFVYAAMRIPLAAAAGAGLRLRWPGHKIAALAALIAAAIYLWLSGGGVATERSFLMVAVMLSAILADRRAISLRTIAVSAVLILIYSPESVASPGFQMSFGATLALILMAGPWARFAQRLPPISRGPLMLLATSLVASFVTSPMAAAHFNRMAHYGLIANLLAVPVMGTLVMPAGVIAALLAPLGLAGPALWVMGVGTEWMLIVAEQVAALRGAVTGLPLPPFWVMPVMCFGGCLCVLSWRRGHMRRRGAALTGFATGLMLIAAGTIGWAMVQRPLLLIAPEGEAVGLMTPAGRAMSKPSGGAFVVGNWLTEDGDIATQEQSAARPAWRGDRRDRVADLPGGVWQVWHFTGKGADERALPECQPNRILVVAAPISPPPERPVCLLIHQGSLRKTGSLAINLGPDGAPVIVSAAETGARYPWAAR
ncbi:MAG: ComEC/Rec2 family competence protein [Paracoccus sp. (in: a-proteobacteria)]|uniref:ComEC/Rec2 family competence protein n=1 Tax=Paracoccus sp. TaxID=267 RepID=UPI0026DEB5F5|nr:ComEC/Rec2 family competence protein [Paracoccus sp. (in: a-proteobacteria)]MDO5630412.1 ComEC/Rec2 family competence protein [Paracoccus sp. (in: a-proteobacteria)]